MNAKIFMIPCAKNMDSANHKNQHPSALISSWLLPSVFIRVHPWFVIGFSETASRK
jgi:hypothetical protein